MNIFPGIPELILAIFSALLSLVVSLFIVKIQKANSKSVKKLGEEQKILIAKQLEVRDFIRGKLVTSKESQDARDFLEKESMTLIDEMDEILLKMKGQEKKIANLSIFARVFLLLTVGLVFYLLFTFVINDGKWYLSEWIILVGFNILSLSIFWLQEYLRKKYLKDYVVFRSRIAYLSSEITRAADVAKIGQ